MQSCTLEKIRASTHGGGGWATSLGNITRFCLQFCRRSNRRLPTWQHGSDRAVLSRFRSARYRFFSASVHNLYPAHSCPRHLTFRPPTTDMEHSGSEDGGSSTDFVSMTICAVLAIEDPSEVETSLRNTHEQVNTTRNFANPSKSSRRSSSRMCLAPRTMVNSRHLQRQRMVSSQVDHQWLTLGNVSMSQRKFGHQRSPIFADLRVS